MFRSLNPCVCTVVVGQGVMVLTRRGEAGGLSLGENLSLSVAAALGGCRDLLGCWVTLVGGFHQGPQQHQQQEHPGMGRVLLCPNFYCFIGMLATCGSEFPD